MDSNFRRLTLKKIAENAGVLTSLVQSALPSTSSASNATFKVLGSVGPHTSVMYGSNAVQPDSSVNIIINVRGIIGGDTKGAQNINPGGNAVIIACEAGGKGSKENLIFGNAAFVNEAVAKVLSFFQKQNPDKNIHLGKLILSGFSGGGSAINALLSQRANIKGDISGVVLNDALHADTNNLKAVVDYAKDAQKNPDKYRFSLMHTSVVPTGYRSTTQVSNDILSQLNMERKPYEGEWNGVGPKPATIAQSGGVQVLQLNDKEQPYKKLDENGNLRPNIDGTAGNQHITALKNMREGFKNMGLD